MSTEITFTPRDRHGRAILHAMECESRTPLFIHVKSGARSYDADGFPAGGLEQLLDRLEPNWRRHLAVRRDI